MDRSTAGCIDAIRADDAKERCRVDVNGIAGSNVWVRLCGPKLKHVRTRALTRVDEISRYSFVNCGDSGLDCCIHDPQLAFDPVRGSAATA